MGTVAMGASQTRPFLLYPARLPQPEDPIVGAAAVHRLLKIWRQTLQPEAYQIGSVLQPQLLP